MSNCSRKYFAQEHNTFFDFICLGSKSQWNTAQSFHSCHVFNINGNGPLFAKTDFMVLQVNLFLARKQFARTGLMLWTILWEGNRAGFQKSFFFISSTFYPYKTCCIKHLIIGETYKYNLCLKCHHTMETLCTHEFCMWLIRVGIRQGFNLFRFEIDRMKRL